VLDSDSRPLNPCDLERNRTIGERFDQLGRVDTDKTTACDRCAAAEAGSKHARSVAASAVTPLAEPKGESLGAMWTK
jgi:hypothetical protein